MAAVNASVASHPHPSAAAPLPPSPAGRGKGEGDARAEVSAAISRAHAAFPAWSATPVETRAACLDRLADLLEEHRDELMAICVQEAFKTIPDAIGEVREAADFCRYYASEARANLHPVELPDRPASVTLHLSGRGVWATIAPWNFPLAIFLGQTVAALVTGNTVVAKPAPQTPAIAARAVALAHEAGVPKDALILATGGPEVGAALTADPRIMGVAFTGSTATARKIARSLLDDESRPIVPLIAETGGINAMIVDSTALPEQVVADVVASSFRSAGQRCSALRLLLVQEDVADTVIEMLSGAMDTLAIGAPGDPATDVGPVIDRAAYDRLMTYRDSVRGQWIKTLEVPSDGLFVPPTLIRLGAIEDLRQEWFGPAAACRDVEGGRAVGDDRARERQGIRPDDGPPQPHRPRGGTGGERGGGGQSVRQPVDDRRRGRVAAVRGRGTVGDGAQGGRAALSVSLCRGASRVGGYDVRWRECDVVVAGRGRDLKAATSAPFFRRPGLEPGSRFCLPAEQAGPRVEPGVTRTFGATSPIPGYSFPHRRPDRPRTDPSMPAAPRAVASALASRQPPRARARHRA